MIDKTNYTDHELALIEIAMEKWPDAFELALNTGDSDLFFKLITKANKIYIEQVLSTLIDKGLVEMTGIDETGDFTFSLTEEGKRVAESLFENLEVEDGPEL